VGCVRRWVGRTATISRVSPLVSRRALVVAAALNAITGISETAPGVIESIGAPIGPGTGEVNPTHRPIAGTSSPRTATASVSHVQNRILVLYSVIAM
jgi:hypothetical protein